MELDRLTDSIRTILDALIGRKLDYLALYPAIAVKQTGNSIDVTPDDRRIPGLAGVPIFSGTPGVTATVPDGTRVLLGFRGGDHRQPYVALWEAVSAPPKDVKLEATRDVEIEGKALTMSGTTSVELDAPAMKLGSAALLAVARMGDAVQAGPWTGVITAGSTKVKAE